MKPHLRYLKYVLIHKLYVLVAGVAINGWSPRWLWRLFIHDLSKFRPSEWRAYVAMFYGIPAEAEARRRCVPPGVKADADLGEHSLAGRVACVEQATADVKKERQARFNYAWLMHQHRNPHHWQHWMLKEDSGKMIVLTPPAVVVDEMLADWIAAGTKILRWPTLAEAVAETVAWYAKNRERIVLREAARARVEENLHALAMTYGLVSMAREVEAAKAARASIVIPGR